MTQNSTAPLLNLHVARSSKKVNANNLSMVTARVQLKRKGLSNTAMKPEAAENWQGAYRQACKYWVLGPALPGQF